MLGSLERQLAFLRDPALILDFWRCQMKCLINRGALEQGVQLVLIGVPQKQIFSDVAPFYKELAEDHKLVFDGELISALLRKRSYKSDMVHFNKSGYQKMAEAIHQLLIDNGAL